ncbi:MAG: radical SAM family heme chaperone HemW [Prevotella sp.]|nr:radical SAM family heme chaperone HemW [Prevotella sp.]
MAGIYIHIPFCSSRCIYCGFYSTTLIDMRQKYVDAVCREIKMRCKTEEGKGERIETIYLGGGTPSQLTIEQLREIFNALYIYNKVSDDAEVTIEVNPDDVTKDFVEGLRTLPVNRISMGAQTFNDKRLQFLHRRHSACQVSEAVNRLREIGISNISIDLMYGFSGETLNDWEKDISSALALNVEHLSAYCLMIEEGTELWRRYNDEGKTCDILPEETEREMYEMLINSMETAGYEHYEISNFAKPGYRSRHNSSYWDGTAYIGIGAAAHSYDGNTRSWNISDISKYIDAMSHDQRLFEYETIDDDTRYNDLITVALRTREGLDLQKLQTKYRDYAIKNARRFINDGLLHLTLSNHLAITRKGLFVSDMIMSELIYV